MDIQSTPQQYYISNTSRLSVDIRSLKQRGRFFVAGEIVSFVLFIAFIAAYAMSGWGLPALLFSFVSLAAYFVTRRADELTDERISYMEAQLAVCEHELGYLRGDFSAFEDGSSYVDANHPYTFDIDVFGPRSLFHRINRTVTTGGSAQLAAFLQHPDTSHIAEHADVIDKLSKAADWRRDFMAEGVNGKVDTADVARALHGVRDVSIPSWMGSKAALLASVLTITVFSILIVLSVFTDMRSSVPVLWGLVMLGMCLGMCHGKLMQISRVVGKLERQAASYVRIVRLVSGLDGQLLGNYKENVVLRKYVDSASEALPSFSEIGSILKSLDRRGNILGLIFSDIFFLSDFFLLRRFVMWQQRYESRMDEWIAAVSSIDALVSMSTFHYNEPRAVRAEIVDGGGNVVFEARNLAHPFIGEKAIGNDFSIADNNYYIITGANMAGKSTFLRSIGINWLLAMCGMPVFADSMRLSVFPLFTSMRTSDDLSRGISYFNAELLRLQQLIEYQTAHPGTLIILDEILKGTNSVDKLNGSRLFLEYMSQRHATYIVATHDLELSRLSDAQPCRFHNYCFEIKLGSSVTYSYRISEGVARNQNATFLLKGLLK